MLQKASHWFLYFLTYSLIGWLYETGVCFFELHQGFVNRGFLWGPWLPVYGFGALAVLLAIQPLQKQKIRLGKIPLTPLLCFAAVVLLAASVELLASYLMEAFTGGWLWDYSDYPCNFQGRIALESSLRFGIIGIAGLYGIQPLLVRGITALESRKPAFYKVMLITVSLLFLTDLAARLFLGSNY